MQKKLGLRSQSVSVAYTQATKVLVMNQKGGVGKSTVVAAIVSGLLQRGYKVSLFDFDKQKSTYDWASTILPGRAKAYNPSFKSLSQLALTLQVERDTDFVIVDTPSNFSNEDMVRYAYFMDGIIIPMAPSPVDLHASLPFIKMLLDSTLLRRRSIDLSFLITRCALEDERVNRVHHLLNHFRQYKTLGKVSEDSGYQEAFYYKQLVNEHLDAPLWDKVIDWLHQLR